MATFVSEEDLNDEFSMFGIELDNEDVVAKRKWHNILRQFLYIRTYTFRTICWPCTNNQLKTGHYGHLKCFI